MQPTSCFPNYRFARLLQHSMFSIDQNSNSLWDTLPKLQALGRSSRPVVHFVEDIDVAFTSLGAGVDDRASSDLSELKIVRERFYPSGGQDWGATLFYSDFLGRLPVELRTLQGQLGMKISAAAKRIGRDIEDLYAEYSVGDNWMLVGPSYVGDRNHHRVMGDLSVKETARYLRETLQRAQADCLEKFPQEDSRARSREWFAAETHRMERLIESCGDESLADLYRRWLGEYLGDAVSLDATSSLFSLAADCPKTALLEVFLRDYATVAGLYNRSVTETDVGLHKLQIKHGELPFFAVLSHRGQLVRTELSFLDGELVIAEKSFAIRGSRLPIEDLREAGVRCIVGKAVPLAMEVRIQPAGRALALPYRGSLYTPAVHRFAALLSENNLLSGPLAPIVRVRFGLLDHLKSLDTTIRLPEHLVSYFGSAEVPARRVGENYADIATEAAGRLGRFKDTAQRNQWVSENFPEQVRTIRELNQQKRQLAGGDSKSPQVRQIWKRIKTIENELLAATLHQIAMDYQAAHIDFYDSRGAILPWCIALGGESFYNEVIAKARITEEIATQVPQ